MSVILEQFTEDVAAQPNRRLSLYRWRRSLLPELPELDAQQQILNEALTREQNELDYPELFKCGGF